MMNQKSRIEKTKTSSTEFVQLNWAALALYVIGMAFALVNIVLAAIQLCGCMSYKMCCSKVLNITFAACAGTFFGSQFSHFYCLCACLVICSLLEMLIQVFFTEQQYALDTYWFDNHY